MEIRPTSERPPLQTRGRDFALASRLQPKLRSVIDGIAEPASVAAVFDNLPAAENFLKTLNEADLGLCINLSTSIEGARRCAKFAGIAPRATMCGHGMISSSLGRKMIDWVKEEPPYS